VEEITHNQQIQQKKKYYVYDHITFINMYSPGSEIVITREIYS